MIPGMSQRTNFDPETEDLALHFVEEEVGRFDWRNNWHTLRVAGTAAQRVTDWLKAIGTAHDPGRIMDYLDRMAETRSGRWL